MIGTKKGKAAEEDGITVAMVEAFEKFGLQKLTEIANSIYDTGEITRQCANSSLKCQNHQEPLSATNGTIAIMSQVTKTVL